MYMYKTIGMFLLPVVVASGGIYHIRIISYYVYMYLKILRDPGSPTKNAKKNPSGHC